MVLYCFEYISTDIDSEKDAASTAIIAALFFLVQGPTGRGGGGGGGSDRSGSMTLPPQSMGSLPARLLF